MKYLNQCLFGDCRDSMRQMISDGIKVQTVISSPPYYGLRDYGTGIWEGGDASCSHKRETKYSDSCTTGHANHDLASGDQIYKDVCLRCGAVRIDKQLGLESTIDEYIENMVEVFGLAWKLLRDDGTLWLNMGDSYVGSWGAKSHDIEGKAKRTGSNERPPTSFKQGNLKTKDLFGTPWRLAFALQAAGWYLRQDIIWEKNNPMPESVRDRPTRSHEYLFLLSKSGDTLLWKHRDSREWSYEYREDFRWVEETTGIEYQMAPTNDDNEKFTKINLWQGFDYFYDQDAIREPSLDPEDDIRRINQQKFSNKSMPYERKSGLRLEWPRLPGGIHRSEKGATALFIKVAVEGVGFQKRIILKEKKEEWRDSGGRPPMTMKDRVYHKLGRNKRSVWTVPTAPYREAHFATFPPKLIEPCILAGSRPGDIVFDPFLGSGTTGQVAQQLGRNWIGCELQRDYEKLQKKRTAQLGMEL